MTRRSFALTLAALLLSAPSLAQQPPVATSPTPGPQRPARDQAAQKPGTGVIRGRVVAADSGTPLRRAVVRASAPELREGRVVTTDAEGKYELKDLPAGRFSIAASKGNYVSTTYGQRRPNQPGTPIELADGQVMERIDFSLSRGSVISGRIVDEFGEPMSGVMIQVLASRAIGGGERRFLPTGTSVTTDDLGQFRSYGLAPGQYAVSATLRSSMMIGSADPLGYPPTYYPGTLSINEAQRVLVAPAVEVPNISFALIPARVARISGTVLDSSGKPPVNANLIIRQGITGSSFAMITTFGGSRVMPDGTFTLNNVVPGEYTLEVRAGTSDAPEVASAPVVVSGDDITGLALVLTRGATARGQLVFEGGMPANARLETIQVRSMSTALVMGSSGVGKVQTDGTFEVPALFGKATLTASPLPSGWRVKEVRLNGGELPPDGYPFKGTEEIAGFEVVLTNQTNEASGTVSDDKGLPLHDYTVVVFSTNRDRWTVRGGHVRSARPDQAGRFKVMNLPAGDYYAAALETIEPGEETDPELLERLKPAAHRFTISSSGPVTMSLKLTRP